MRKLRDDLSVGEAAEVLGVTPWTLRYWDRTNKLEPTRHPLSKYRLYRREQLDALLQQAENRPLAAAPNPTTTGASRAAGKRTSKAR